MASSSSSSVAAAAGSTAGSDSSCSMPAYVSSHGQQSGNLTPTGQSRGQPHQACADSSYTTKQADEMAAGICSSHQPAASGNSAPLPA
eukprot:5411798-Pleurochrysis_carterae.AAC.1